MGTFKKVEKKTCTACDGSGSVSYTVKNPNRRPRFYRWMIDPQTEEYQNNSSMRDEYFNYSKTQTESAQCDVCCGTGEVTVAAKADPNPLPSLKRSENKAPKPIGHDLVDQIERLSKELFSDMDYLIAQNASYSRTGPNLDKLVKAIEGVVPENPKLVSQRQKEQITLVNEAAFQFFSEYERAKISTPFKSKILLDSLYSNMIDLLDTKAKQLGLLRKTQELGGIRIHYLDYWSNR